MASIKTRHLLIFLLVTFVNIQRVRVAEQDNSLFRALRDKSNQNKTDSLNLPANASSIRENITDTFSCENRTYGYYADVDNDCQVFHVCLPSQTPSGRNVTYRWSFICPNETVFNQEVLTCTTVPDSIDCKDSPNFYHLNMEIGKESNKTEKTKEKSDSRKIHKRKPEKTKENMILEHMVMENVIKEIMNEKNDELNDNLNDAELTKKEEISPVLIEAVIESVDTDVEDAETELRSEEEIDRLIMERNIRSERKMKRGSFRFKGDV